MGEMTSGLLGAPTPFVQPKISRVEIKKVGNGFLIQPNYGDVLISFTLHEATEIAERLMS